MYRNITAYWNNDFPITQAAKNLPAMQEIWVRSLGREDPLEKRVAIHSNIFAWRIPWTEEPGRLQFKVSQRVGNNWATNTTNMRVSSVVQKIIIYTKLSKYFFRIYIPSDSK